MLSQSMIKPTPKQLAYQSWEFGLFVHFGLRTFYEGYVDFDTREMSSPSVFNPVDLDCEQWIRTAKEAGMKYAVLTAKHHDGFSNWPSQYTSFSVAQSSWKEGKGDVVKEFIDACRKYDMKTGLYYSPFDGSAGVYQNAKAYDDYFVNQITELLGNYGDIDILWFDGCGSEDHEYDWVRIIREIRRLQPNISIFNMGDPDFRWVGNEDGIAPIPCWNVVDSTEFSILTEQKEALGEQLWLPAECDVQMRANWFYSDQDEHTVKTLDQLMGIYYYSVGRGANLLLNIGPDRQGLLPAKDTSQLQAMGAEIRRRFENPIATLEQCKHNQLEWVYEPAQPHLLDHIVIQEDLSLGEHVRSFQISVITEKTKRPIIVYEGQNIGHKAIIRIPSIKVQGITITVTNTVGIPAIHHISFYYVGG